MAKILLVEDDTLIGSIIARELSAAGHEMSTVITGTEVLPEAHKTLPSLILLDLLIPEKDGFEILKDLKADPITAPIPVIVLSNLGQEQDIKRAKENGALDFMVKVNFTPKEILAKVNGVLEKMKV